MHVTFNREVQEKDGVNFSTGLKCNFLSIHVWSYKGWLTLMDVSSYEQKSKKNIHIPPYQTINKIIPT
jgi:hypothetical protein